MSRIAVALVVLVLAVPVHAGEVLLRSVATLPKPVAIAHAGDARLFIATQRGQIYIHENGALRAVPFLDIREKVLCCGEHGFLSLAFHPRYAENGIFFVSYVQLDADIAIARYRVSGDPNAAIVESETIVMTVPHQQSLMHYGGHIAFGPDGYLYIGVGDGGGSGWMEAGRLDSLLGKILRIDVDLEPYAVPPTNPFAHRSDSRREVWALGLRNPWQFSFDRETGDLWIADVGDDIREEVNLQPAHSGGGEDYGWYGMEGTYCHEDSGLCDNTDWATKPILEYDHVDGGCSVTGGYRYRGERHPSWQGQYFYGDFCTGTIFAATATPDGTWSSRVVYRGGHFFTTFGEDASGELYVADYRGEVFALDVAPSRRRATR